MNFIYLLWSQLIEHVKTVNVIRQTEPPLWKLNEIESHADQFLSFVDLDGSIFGNWLFAQNINEICMALNLTFLWQLDCDIVSWSFFFEVREFGFSIYKIVFIEFLSVHLHTQWPVCLLGLFILTLCVQFYRMNSSLLCQSTGLVK